LVGRAGLSDRNHDRIDRSVGRSLAAWLAGRIFGLTASDEIPFSFAVGAAAAAGLNA
jgi:hypothetical protein